MQEISNLHELKKKQYGLYVYILLVLFFVMAIYTIFWCVSFNNDYGSFEEATATCIELKDGDDDVYGYALEYYDSVNNVMINNTSTDLANKNTVGKSFSVYYDTENPSSVVQSLSVGRILLPILTSVFGVAFVCLVVLYLLTFKRKHSTMQTNNNSLKLAKNNRKETLSNFKNIVLKNKLNIYKKTSKKG